MALRGGCKLTASLSANGSTFLREQHFSAPIHISKPHHDEGWLVVNLVSPTPGLLEGDRVECKVSVKQGARMLLTAPSANRIHCMRNGSAELAQQFDVANGGSLDVWPEYLIPQAASCYTQKSVARVEEGGTLIWTESVAPGRVASGEIFAFNEVKLYTDVFLGNQPLVRERYRLRPADSSTQALSRIFPTPYYASIICISPQIHAHAELVARIHTLHEESHVWVGCSDVQGKGCVVKIIACDSPTLRRTVARTRDALYQALNQSQPRLRRVTGLT